MLFYCDINLRNPNLCSELPCPAGRPGLLAGPGSEEAFWQGLGFGALWGAVPFRVPAPSSQSSSALGSSHPSTGRRCEQPAVLCSSSGAERMAGAGAVPGFGRELRGTARGREGGRVGLGWGNPPPAPRGGQLGTKRVVKPSSGARGGGGGRRGDAASLPPSVSPSLAAAGGARRRRLAAPARGARGCGAVRSRAGSVPPRWGSRRRR